VEFTINGERHDLTRAGVESILSTLEPESVHTYSVEVEGRRFPVKQVLAESTGLSVTDFDSTRAQRILQSLGFEVLGGISVVTELTRRARRVTVSEAAGVVLHGGLRRQPSVLDGRTVTWTAETATELRDAIASSGLGTTFRERLVGQLTGRSRAVVLLAAELCFIQRLPLINVLAPTKQALMQDVLDLLPDRPPVPEAVAAALATPGTFHGGRGSTPRSPSTSNGCATSSDTGMHLTLTLEQRPSTTHGASGIAWSMQAKPFRPCGTRCSRSRSPRPSRASSRRLTRTRSATPSLPSSLRLPGT
jgi:5-methylcytosine-specific restriction protein B